MKHTNKGFSLIELIVVVSIMAVLVGVLSPSLLRYVEKARAQKDTSAMSEYTQGTIIAMADSDVYAELNAAASLNSTASGALRIVFHPDSSGIMSLKTASFSNGALLTAVATSLADELKSIISNKVQLTSQTYKSCPYTIEIKTDSNGFLSAVYGYWGTAVNAILNVKNRDNKLKDLFEATMTAGTQYSFLVFNSTYTNNNAGISTLNKGLLNLGDNTDIKTWSIITDKKNKNEAYDASKINYLISTVDISNTTQWNVGDQVPAIMQKADGTVEVGMATLYKQTDGKYPYYVLSRDENGKNSHDSGFNSGTVLKNKQTFSSLAEAYDYYETLDIVKVS